MIKENLDKGLLISGTGRKIHFDKEIYLKAVKFIMKKFNLTISQATGQLNYMLVTDLTRKNGKLVYRCKNDKRSTNARLKNIITLDYDWQELWNK